MPCVQITYSTQMHEYILVKVSRDRIDVQKWAGAGEENQSLQVGVLWRVILHLCLQFIFMRHKKQAATGVCTNSKMTERNVNFKQIDDVSRAVWTPATSEAPAGALVTCTCVKDKSP